MLVGTDEDTNGIEGRMDFASNGISNHTAGHFSECLCYTRALKGKKKTKQRVCIIEECWNFTNLILWSFNQQILANFHRHNLGTVSLVKKSF